jgi:hypothetical protein
MWAQPIPTNISGVPLGLTLGTSGITNNAVMLSANALSANGGGSTPGWIYLGAMDATTGAQMWIANLTNDAALQPYTRITTFATNGVYLIANLAQNWVVDAYDVRTGTQVWHTTLTGDNGAAPNVYDQFGIKAWNAPGDMTIFVGLGGDIWCINDANGKLAWYTNTTALVGSSGIETPYNVWPLWEFNSDCFSNGVAYLAEGHEYDPPLFHGAQLLAINVTNGNLIWSTLDFSVDSTEISYGVILSLNSYDNQLYAFSEGPSATTVTAPNIGVTTVTPITITGTVMDVSAGTQQQAVKSNFPNGLPAVSDASQSHWMEYVYEQQPYPTGTTGVPVTLSVIDANNNFRTIGTTTSDASGTYALTWTPDIPGNYTVVANFAGSNSYYPSSAETHFYATSPQSSPTATAQTNLATSDLVNNLMIYLFAGVIAIIIAIAIAAVLIIRKRP